LSRGYSAAAGVGLLIATGFVVLGLGSHLLTGPGTTLLFILSVALFTIFGIQDAVLTALGRAGWVPVENIAFSLVKLIVLPLLAFKAAGPGIFAAWAGPVIIAVGVISMLIFGPLAREQIRLSGGAESLPDRRTLVGFVSGQYIAGILNTIVAAAPPVFVSYLSGPQQSAFFYVPWLVGTSLQLLLGNIVMSLVASASGDSGQAHTHFRKGIGLGLLVTLGGAAVIAMGAAPILYVLGSQYAAAGTTSLRLIGLALPFTGVVFLFRAFTVILERSWAVVVVQAMTVVLFFGGSYFGLHRYGVAGVAGAFLAAEAITALTVLPWIIRSYRSIVRGAGRRVATVRASGPPTAEFFPNVDTMLIYLPPRGRVYSSLARRENRTVDPNASTPTELLPLPLAPSRPTGDAGARQAVQLGVPDDRVAVVDDALTATQELTPVEAGSAAAPGSGWAGRGTRGGGS
jgi:hypothetical protein